MSGAPSSRRGFLSGLVSLPLIGGGVTLIGSPSASAVPVSRSLLNCYNEWLFMERRLLAMEQHPGLPDAECFVPTNTGAGDFHLPIGTQDWRALPSPSSRAALVLSAVGCEWREARQW